MLMKSMLAAPHNPVLQLFGGALQECLLHHLPEDRDEGDDPAVPCVLLEDRSDLHSFLQLKSFS